MPTLMANLCYAASFGCLVFAAHLFAARPRNPIPARILGAAFLVFTAQAALLGARLGGWIEPAITLRPILAMTIGPLLYLYFASVADPAFRPRPIHLLHFAPALGIGLQFLIRAFPVDVDLAIFLSFAAYGLALAAKARRGPALFGHLGEGAAKALRLMIAVAVLLGVLFVADLAIFFDLLRGTLFAQSPALLVTQAINLAIVAVAVVAALRRPSPFDWMYAYGGRARTTDYVAGEDERAACAAAFDRLVADERIHLDEAISLESAARRLGVPPRRLSEAINSVHGESFSRRINRLRVEEAKRLLRDRPGLSIIAVMFNSGFRTKSSFNKEFRALAGVSPTDYRSGR